MLNQYWFFTEKMLALIDQGTVEYCEEVEGKHLRFRLTSSFNGWFSSSLVLLQGTFEEKQMNYFYLSSKVNGFHVKNVQVEAKDGKTFLQKLERGEVIITDGIKEERRNRDSPLPWDDCLRILK